MIQCIKLEKYMLCTTLHWKLLTWIFIPYTRIFYDIGSLLFYTICRILLQCWNLRIFHLFRFYVKSILVILLLGESDNLRAYLVNLKAEVIEMKLQRLNMSKLIILKILKSPKLISVPMSFVENILNFHTVWKEKRNIFRQNGS